ncbi:MAG: PBSX family phage terminase large subunit [Planctomycetaceae bacterium]|nr:PBSX family phage terminase large subunit [Planctomycetaceae bacterium]
MNITKSVSPSFENFIFDWHYKQYLLIGGYGSGKSYQVALKIILKLFQEKRRVLVVREVFGTIYESCYHLFYEILDDMELVTKEPTFFRKKGYGKSSLKVLASKSPLSFTFPNGSQIIFKGLDNPEKIKSINDVSIVWIEEAAEIKYASYKEILGRIRVPNDSLHFILSCNPVGCENWIYNHFFRRQEEGERSQETVILDENKLYDAKEMIADGTYYHHSTPDDNPFLPKEYLKTLDDLRKVDIPLYTVARWGRFGATGTRVLPQFEIADKMTNFRAAVQGCDDSHHYFGFDFGFEESYNAVISMCIDVEKKILYIYDEIYMNRVTDDVFANQPEMQALKEKLDSLNKQGCNKMLVADNEDPKAISYYRQQGFSIRGCRNKFAGSGKRPHFCGRGTDSNTEYPPNVRCCGE